MGYSPWGCKELDTTERLSTHTYKIICFFQSKKIKLKNVLIQVYLKNKHYSKGVDSNVVN